MQEDHRYGVFHQVAREHYELPCRKCGNEVVESAIQCKCCGTYAPGIYSACPVCYSENYTWKPYGRNDSAMLGGLLLLGPIGMVLGAAWGSSDTECVCLHCGQGWMPFSVMGGKWSTTRKFRLKEKNKEYSRTEQQHEKGQKDNGIKSRYDIKTANAVSSAAPMTGVINSYDANSLLGEIYSSSRIYKIIIQRNTKLQEFPNGYPVYGDRVTFLPQEIGGTLYASNIKSLDYKPTIEISENPDNGAEFIITDKRYIWDKGVVVTGDVPKNMKIQANTTMYLLSKGKAIDVFIKEVWIDGRQQEEAFYGDCAELIISGVSSEMDINYKDILKNK